MTELEKCNAGLPYRFDDPEMVARKTRAITECERFNAIDGTDYEAQYHKYWNPIMAGHQKKVDAMK